MLQYPPWAKIASAVLADSPKTVTGTVSSKVEKKFGWSCKACTWVYLKPDHLPVIEDEYNSREDLQLEGYERYVSKRCPPCVSGMRKWQRAKKIFVHLDELRMNEDIDCLRFTTLTRKEWELYIPFDQMPNMEELRDAHKKKCIRSFRNWRFTNKWWGSREVLGQFWPECTITPIWKGVAIDEYKLHFHLHMVLVSKYLDNKPKLNYGITPNGEAVFQDDSRFYKEWGGIVDVRAVRDYQVKYIHKGEERRGCGRRACMKYLVKYITKADHWKSVKIGKW